MPPISNEETFKHTNEKVELENLNDTYVSRKALFLASRLVNLISDRGFKLEKCELTLTAVLREPNPLSSPNTDDSPSTVVPGQQ